MMPTDQQIESWATEFEHGVTPEQLQGADWVEGSYAWILSVVDDVDKLTQRAHAENLTLEELVKKALNHYLDGEPRAS